MTVFCDDRHDNSPFRIVITVQNEEKIESLAEKLSLITLK
jgi:hypothetical protein